MRELLVGRTAIDELRAAQEAAISAIGMRGDKARYAMRKTRHRILREQAEARWLAVIKAARQTRFEALRKDEEAREVWSISTLVSLPASRE